MAKKNETIINVLKEKYEYENERKRYYDNVITLPVSLLAFIVSGIYFIVRENLGTVFLEEIKPCLIYSLLVSTVISMFFLYRVFFGLKRKYCSFPTTEAVLSDFEKIKQYYANSPQNKKTDENIESDFEDFVIYWYKDINENNVKVNDTRAANFHLSKIFIGLSYLLAILVYSLYCYGKINFKPMAKQNTTQQAPPPPRPSPSPVRREKADNIVTPKK